MALEKNRTHLEAGTSPGDDTPDVRIVFFLEEEVVQEKFSVQAIGHGIKRSMKKQSRT